MSKWTQEQSQAIDSRGSNLLLSAAAGSGKTAVLVQRVINLILKDELDIDRLLIVTFTQAAAAEMRERINQAIFEELQWASVEAQKHLRRQLTLLSQSSISTIHSFCREVIKKYFFLIDIDPNFRVADESESAIIRMDVMEELIESEYEAGQPEFMELVEMFGGSKSDEGLLDLIGQAYAFVQSQPEPEAWLQESADRFKLSPEEFADSPWLQELGRQFVLQLEAARDMLYKALKMSERPGGPAVYTDIIQDEILQLEQLMEYAVAHPEVFYQKLHALSFKSLKRADKDTDRYLKEKAQQWRSDGKKLVEKLRKGLLDPQQYRQDLEYLYPYMQYLCDLVLKFSSWYRQKKKDKNILDFNDLEHLALSILEQEGVAEEYQRKYEHIFVDEYQDSNLLQECILSAVSRSNNRFLVGDIKQSIYRFRNAEPSLFLDKYLTYATEEVGINRRIDLGRNFRSRAHILAGINYLFAYIMSRELGEIDYDRQAMLYPGLSIDEAGDADIQLILVEKSPTEGPGQEDLMDELEELSDIALEARIAASRVRELVGSMVYDARKGEYRQVDFRDIVILMRATRRWAAEFMEVFRAQGIPVYTDSSGGYFEAVEVDLILKLLKLIDNRRQDIPLLSVMRSPIGGFDIYELTQIRLSQPQGNYYEALDNYQEHLHNELSKKIHLFLSQLEGWREKSRLMPIDEFIHQLLMETGYYYYVAAMPGGKQRQANLEVLVNRARQFQESSIKGLFNFTRFIENIKSSSSDLDLARVLGENDNVVRIMSIHKSKGLEFPVVIVAGLGKGFNRADTRGRVLFHSRLGMGPVLIRSDLRTKTDTIARTAMQYRIQVENLSEEMRILYVAMTRAQSKLILLGSVKNLPRQAEKWCNTSNAYELIRARNYLDWIGPALAHHAGIDALRQLAGEGADGMSLQPDDSGWQIELLSRYHLQAEENRKSQLRTEFKQKLEEYPGPNSSYEPPALIKRLDWDYPYHLAVKLPSKLSVSQLKQIGWEEREAVQISIIGSDQAGPGLIPAQDSLLTSLEKGILMHLLMQHIEFKPYQSLEEIEQAIEPLLYREILTRSEAGFLDKTAILGFFQSFLGQRAIQASRIYRETAFNRVVAAREIIPEAGDLEEKMLIQGVIDLYFVEGGEAVLVDYKTDQLQPLNRQARIESYRIQLEQYRKAIEEIKGIKVKEGYLYFFTLGEGVKVL
ncbi:MAG: helicase-exonuclease AddAB subunit AddA [Syntrophomonadaceae bacterium]|nr:helicase-exonuclease AddAB subunit AddA [Syntrophomonadaceae bacterium]